ncbi:transposase [Jeotgalibacillus aurantiacus]|uniref:transposase n=1 Tax=Jeotgalibacillus aurantiacus TaxID=2763266 RepID=UPI001D0A3E52|nr:transposase [Jeotgalibacillus aurantiacus]
MPRQKRTLSKTDFYHVIIRGANRQEIFHDEDDRIEFINIIERKRRDFPLVIHAWCQMGNHVHFLIKCPMEKLSLFMKRIGVSYVKYYHGKYKTNGHLFQDRFKSEEVETEHYLLTVVRYIHQNPVIAGITNKPNEWKWSSCSAYYHENGPFSSLIETSLIMNFFNHSIPHFKTFNEETKKQDWCMSAFTDTNRLSDQQARKLIAAKVGTEILPHIKSLPKEQRDPILHQIKQIPHLSIRQAARLLGVSQSLIYRA